MKKSIFIFLLTVLLIWPSAGNAATPKRRASSSVFLVGVYEAADQPERGFRQPCTSPGTAQVSVGVTSEPITLVLSSYECVLWGIIREDGAEISKVIVSGYYESSVTGVDDVLVTKHFYDDGNDTSLGAYPHNKKGLKSPNSAYCKSFPSAKDCKFSPLDQLLRTLRKNEGIKTYNSFKGRYAGSRFTIEP